jgi:hypothetical protein
MRKLATSRSVESPRRAILGSDEQVRVPSAMPVGEHSLLDEIDQQCYKGTVSHPIQDPPVSNWQPRMTTSPNRAINQLLMRIVRRAEKAAPDYLAQTFVPIEPVPALLDSLDSHVIYGRRGTGKTHLLKYLAEIKKRDGDIALYLDLRLVGSSGGLYADSSQPLALRATHLLIDVVEAVHEGFYDLLSDTRTFDEVLDLLIPSLDAIGEAATQVRVVGNTENATVLNAGTEDDHDRGLKVTLAGSGPSITGNAGSRRKRTRNVTSSKKQSGLEILTVKFGPLSRAVNSLVHGMHGRKLWLLLDEWSSVPHELQPYLADLLKRTFFPIAGVSVKIGALERQSNFRVSYGSEADYLGIELGADTAASLDLDDFLVFRSDRSHASVFFSQLLYQHVAVLMSSLGYKLSIPSAEAFRRTAFAGEAFDELVRASEGVPRDALNIAGLAAAIANDKVITAANVDVAAREYFLRDKEGKISRKAERMLNGMVADCVAKERREIALKRYGESDNPVVQELYDNRLLHRIRQGVVLDDDYSTKFDLYLVDFGCFVDLLSRGSGHTISDGTDILQIALSPRVRLNSSSVARLPPGKG